MKVDMALMVRIVLAVFKASVFLCFSYQILHISPSVSPFFYLCTCLYKLEKVKWVKRLSS